LHGKGNKERRTQLTDVTVEHLKQYLQVFHANSSRDAYLFSTTIKGKTDKMSQGNVQRIISQYAKIARATCSEMPSSVHPHMFRRTRATNLYQDGVELELVSSILGHAHLKTTKIYAIPSVKQIRDAMDSVPSPASGEEPLWIGNEEEMARICGVR
jgi:site-specific recombinase XerD